MTRPTEPTISIPPADPAATSEEISDLLDLAVLALIEATSTEECAQWAGRVAYLAALLTSTRVRR